MKTAAMGILFVVIVAGAALLWYRSNLPSGRLAPRTGHPVGGRVEKSDAEWAKELTPEQFRVTRLKGTERACSGPYHDLKDDGVYHCVCCDQPLFDAGTKFDSGTGWPSYWQPIDEDNLTLRPDNGFLGPRVEVLCSRCDAHLGHVFEDGPAPTGLRYCINAVALKFEPRGKGDKAEK